MKKTIGFVPIFYIKQRRTNNYPYQDTELDSTKRFFLSHNLSYPFHCCTEGNGIRTHDIIFLYVDLANKCLKPLDHISKLLIKMELYVLGLAVCLKEGLSDPINYVSCSALAYVLFLYERDSIQIFHSLGEAFCSMNTTPLNDKLTSSRHRLGRTQGQANP
ncbi:hypothetical protein H5410_031663 [Solanum commersonii]|uniref:Uncharacterized protein n=1 Tax=Solanum commersonii TaxID=4109 RepID=A0A9J5YJU3_SOLCO|nr:hypothetical protein H5410_031663 [Solanum commersonii]